MVDIINNYSRLTTEKIVAEKYHEKQYKRLLWHNKLEKQHEDERNNDLLESDYFNRTDDYDNLFFIKDDYYDKSTILNELQQQAEAPTDVNKLSQLVESCIDTEEYEIILKFLRPGVLTKDKLKKLIEDLERQSDDGIDAGLDTFIKNNNLSIEEICVLLSYGASQKKSAQQTYLNTLCKKLFNQLAKENFQYLLDFFNASKMPQATHELVKWHVATKSNNSLVSLKDTLTAIQTIFPNNLDNLVSKIIRLRFVELTKLAKFDKLSNEETTALKDVVALETNLIIINSTQKLMLKFFEKLIKNGSNLNVEQQITVKQIIALHDFTIKQLYVTEFELSNLFASVFNLPKIKQLSFSVLNYVVELFIALPIKLYNNNDKQKLNRIAAIRKIFGSEKPSTSAAPNTQKPDNGKFSFLKNSIDTKVAIAQIDHLNSDIPEFTIPESQKKLFEYRTNLKK